MIIIIPGWLISMITFPGVVLHEISHRFFCDFFNVPVLAVEYFIPFEETVGCVVHLPTHRFRDLFFIAMGPLLINSFVCMLCTIPLGTTLLFKSGFIVCHSSLLFLAKGILGWIGLSAGFNAIPSKQDMNGLNDEVESVLQRVALLPLRVLVALANIEYIGSFIRLGFMLLLMFAIPWFFIV